MADIYVTIFVKDADKAKADILAAAFPGGAGTFQRAVCSTPGQTNMALAEEWLGTGPMDANMVAAFEASARLAEIQGQLELEEDPTLIAPYQVWPLEGTDIWQQLAQRGLHFIEPE